MGVAVMNAHDNPFATARVEARLPFDPELVGTDWESVMRRWQVLGGRACVTGRHGAGKTTFLDAFAKRLPGKVHRFFFTRERSRLSDDDRRRMAEAKGAVWLVDGDMHLRLLDRLEFHRATRQAAGWLSARHRAGRMPILLDLKPDPELALSLLGRIDPGDSLGLGSRLPERFHRCGGNLRELWLDCYDLLAGRETTAQKNRTS